MRIPNWLAALGAIILCVGMVFVAIDESAKGQFWFSVLDYIMVVIWGISAIFLTWRAIRRPNATYSRLWDRRK